MAFRRRFAPKRRTFKRKRNFRRRFARRRGMGANAKRFFKLRQVLSIAVPSGQAYTIAITDNPSLSQDWVPVSDLFQLYRTNGIKLTYIPTTTNNPLNTAAGYSPVYLIHDTNNTITTPITENEILQYENLRVQQVNRMWSRFWRMKRRINPTASTSISTNGYSSVTQPQITQNIRIFIPSMGTIANPTVGRLIVTYYVTAVSRN